MKSEFKILFLIVVFVSAISLHSQSLIKNFGAKSEISFLNYSYNFNSLPNIPRPDMPLTISKNFPVFVGGGIISLNISDNFFLTSSLLFSKSKLDFLDFENITVIIQGEPIEALIRHNLETNINNFEFSLGFGYNFFNTINLSLQFAFNFPISTYFIQRQTIISPDDLEYIIPIGNHEGKINNLSQFIFSTRTTISLDENILSFGKIGISPEISFKFLVNSYLSSSDWKFTAISAGLNLLYINKNKQNIIYDTTLTRDTTTIFSSQINNETIELKETRIIHDSLFSENSITHNVYIKEIYERQIPKPLPILIGELKTVFVSVNGTESVASNIEYVKNIYNIYSIDRKEKKDKIEKKIDTVSSLIIPSVRFYPSAFSEAGLQEWQIKISNENKIIKSFVGYGSIPDIINWDPFENTIITEFTDKIFQYEFILKDYEEQQIVASTGEIIFKQREKGEKINNITLIAVEPTKIYHKSFKRLFADLKRQKKVVLYPPFLNEIEKLLKPDIILEANNEILQIISGINKNNDMIIIGFI